MRYLSITTFLLLLLACEQLPSGRSSSSPDHDPSSEETDTSDSVMSEPEIHDPISLPADWQLLADVRGDLTKDGVPERVLIIEQPSSDTEEAPPRQLHFYRQEGGSWVLWQQIDGGVLPGDAGGMLGDPFVGASIERGCLVVEHFGGSRTRWSYIHRYRRQHEAWEMIGATVVYGASCDYWHSFDYNLSTGKIIGKIETENCEQETSATEEFEFTHRLQSLPVLGAHEPGSVEVAVPGSELSFYF